MITVYVFFLGGRGGAQHLGNICGGACPVVLYNVDPVCFSSMPPPKTVSNQEGGAWLLQLVFFGGGGGTAKESSFRHGAVAKSTSRHVEALGRHLDVGRRDEALVAVGPQDPHPAVAFVLLHDGQKLALRHRDGALARACVWRGWGGGGRTNKKKSHSSSLPISGGLQRPCSSSKIGWLLTDKHS